MLFVNFRDDYNSINSEDISTIYSAVSINLVKLEKVLTGTTDKREIASPGTSWHTKLLIFKM